MDTTGFRGETPAEQERDRNLVLAVAKKLLENQRVKGKVDDQDGENGEEMMASVGPDDGMVPHKAPARSSRKKKESKWDYYPADFDLDEELVVDSSKKKRPKKKPPVRSDRPAGGSSKKRKRDTAEMEYIYADQVILEPEVEEDEYVEVPQASTSFKKPKATTARRSFAPSRGIVKEKEKDERTSKLLDLARKYNAKRAPRDLNPFGAPLPELELVDFDLPGWLRLEEEAEYGPVVRDEITEASIGEAEMTSKGGSFREQESGEMQPLTGDYGVEMTSPRLRGNLISPYGRSAFANEEAESSVLSELTDDDGEQEVEETRDEGVVVERVDDYEQMEA